MTDKLAFLKPAPLAPKHECPLSTEFAADLSELAPGERLLLTAKGEEFIVLSREDYEHILQLAGLRFE